MKREVHRDSDSGQKKKKVLIPDWVKQVICFIVIFIVIIALVEKFKLTNYLSENSNTMIIISVSLMVAAVILILAKFIYNFVRSISINKMGTIFEFIRININYPLIFAVGLFLFIAFSEIKGKEDFCDLSTTIATLSKIIENAAQPFVIVTLLLAVVQKYNVWFEMKPKISKSDVAIAIMDQGSVKTVRNCVKEMNLNIPIIHIEIKDQIESGQMEDLKGAIAQTINYAKDYNPTNVHLFIKGPILIGTMVGAMASNNLNINLYHWNNNRYQPYGKIAHNTYGVKVDQSTFMVKKIDTESE